MRLFGRRGHSEPPDPRFVGRWFGLFDGEPVEVTFEPEGRMRYLVHSGGKQQLMLLTWRVEADALVTDQPSHPRAERTPFRFDGPDLVLIYDGVETRYTRNPARSIR